MGFAAGTGGPSKQRDQTLNCDGFASLAVDELCILCISTCRAFEDQRSMSRTAGIAVAQMANGPVSEEEPEEDEQDYQPCGPPSQDGRDPEGGVRRLALEAALVLA